MDSKEFPPNPGKKKKTPEEDRPVPEQIVENVRQRPTPLGRKFKGVFLGGDFKVARNYMFFDVFVPSVRDTIYNMFTKGLERVLYDLTGRQLMRTSNPQQSRIQFSNPIRRDPREAQSQATTGPHPTRQAPRNSYDIGEFIFETREEAELVVEQLMAIADQYDYATVGQLYGMMGWDVTFTDQRWGWTNLSTVEIKHVKAGYLIELPVPESVGG